MLLAAGSGHPAQAETRKATPSSAAPAWSNWRRTGWRSLCLVQPGLRAGDRKQQATRAFRPQPRHAIGDRPALPASRQRHADLAAVYQPTRENKLTSDRAAVWAGPGGASAVAAFMLAFLPRGPLPRPIGTGRAGHSAPARRNDHSARHRRTEGICKQVFPQAGRQCSFTNSPPRKRLFTVGTITRYNLRLDDVPARPSVRSRHRRFSPDTEQRCASLSLPP